MVKSFKLIALSKITHVVQVIQVEAGVSWAESPASSSKDSGAVGEELGEVNGGVGDVDEEGSTARRSQC